MSRARKEGDRGEKTEKSNFFFPQRNQNYVEVRFFFFTGKGERCGEYVYTQVLPFSIFFSCFQPKRKGGNANCKS